jgi:hypothetical protein
MVQLGFSMELGRATYLFVLCCQKGLKLVL